MMVEFYNFFSASGANASFLICHHTIGKTIFNNSSILLLTKTIKPMENEFT
jgi:hypothetical protein